MKKLFILCMVAMMATGCVNLELFRGAVKLKFGVDKDAAKSYAKDQWNDFRK